MTPAGSRARDFGITIGKFLPGKYNAITDVAGVRVGHVTLASGDGPLVPGKGPVRTGVTVIMPSDGNIWTEKVTAGAFALNGNGEATGLMWVQESGVLETPIALTNTLSVASAQQGLLDWMLSRNSGIGISDDTLMPVVMECDDGVLNDIRGQHVCREHVVRAIESAATGAVAEGCVGAGTGMMAYDFKGGIGTSSRTMTARDCRYVVGVLVNANHGCRRNLRCKGVPVGELITDLMPNKNQDGSINIIIATDAPLDGRQLARLAKRSMLGLARTGAVAYHGSGDIAMAFATANRIPHYPQKPEMTLRLLSDFWLDDIFEAVADATEEAVLNALLAAKTTCGRDGNMAYALPHDKLRRILQAQAASQAALTL